MGSRWPPQVCRFLWRRKPSSFDLYLYRHYKNQRRNARNCRSPPDQRANASCGAQSSICWHCRRSLRPNQSGHDAFWQHQKKRIWPDLERSYRSGQHCCKRWHQACCRTSVHQAVSIFRTTLRASVMCPTGLVCELKIPATFPSSPTT